MSNSSEPANRPPHPAADDTTTPDQKQGAQQPRRHPRPQRAPTSFPKSETAVSQADGEA